MEILALLAIVALLMFGPRRHGRPQSPAVIKVKVALLVWLVVAFGLSWAWYEIVGPIPQP